MKQYLISVKKQLSDYKLLCEKAISRLEENQFFIRPNSNSNSIAVIIKHMHGNMLSRWTDFLTTDGEKIWRKRDEEFRETIESRESLMRKWEEGWTCLFSALDLLSIDDLVKTVYIRNEPHSVIDAINRQLAHYTYHIGQIVFYAKQLRDSWETIFGAPSGK
jgi:uncharacterized damage-inducible protein DinB